MLNQQQNQATQDFTKAMVKGALEPKTAYMVRMAAAMAFSCYP